jgi:hypothetical protein
LSHDRAAFWDLRPCDARPADSLPLNPNGVTQSQDKKATVAGDPNGLNFGYETLGDTSGVTCTGVPAP